MKTLRFRGDTDDSHPQGVSCVLNVTEIIRLRQAQFPVSLNRICLVTNCVMETYSDLRKIVYFSHHTLAGNWTEEGKNVEPRFKIA